MPARSVTSCEEIAADHVPTCFKRFEFEQIGLASAFEVADRNIEGSSGPHRKHFSDLYLNAKGVMEMVRDCLGTEIDNCEFL